MTVNLYENPMMHILLPQEPHLCEHYIPHGTDCPGGREKRLGDYEKILLEKMINPPLPVIVIVGDMGSGKTTTLKHLRKYYLYEHQLKTLDLEARTTQKRKRRIIGYIDFLREFRGKKETEVQTKEALQVLTSEMAAKVHSLKLLPPKQEVTLFLDHLFQLYESPDRDEVLPVVRPLWAHLSPLDTASDRFKVLEERKKDAWWYLRYLALMWAFLSDSSSVIGRKLEKEKGILLEKGVIFLDNLDSLSPNLQRDIYDAVIGAASSKGPTFVLFMRPETFIYLNGYLGKADHLVDKIPHEGATPIEVIKVRLEKFVERPENYFRGSLSEQEERRLAIRFVQRLLKEMESDDAFSQFIQAAAGQSIRRALVLAQGVLMLPKEEMKRKDLTQHFIIRSCITQGERHYKWTMSSPIENIFRVDGWEKDLDTILLKLKILQFLISNTSIHPEESSISPSWNGKAYLSELRNVLVSLGYHQGQLRSALNQMMRKSCQLIASNGESFYDERWSSHNDVLFVTPVGLGYFEHLIFSVNYLQEIAWDSRAYPVLQEKYTETDDERWDQLSTKFKMLHHFLQLLLQVDIRLTERGIKRFRLEGFVNQFGGRLVTAKMIIDSYRSIKRILFSAARRYPHNELIYNEVITDFESLAIIAKNKEEDFGFPLGIRETEI